MIDTVDIAVASPQSILLPLVNFIQLFRLSSLQSVSLGGLHLWPSEWHGCLRSTLMSVMPSSGYDN